MKVISFIQLAYRHQDNRGERMKGLPPVWDSVSVFAEV